MGFPLTPGTGTRVLLGVRRVGAGRVSRVAPFPGDALAHVPASVAGRMPKERPRRAGRPDEVA
jgi:hypothetical protein